MSKRKIFYSLPASTRFILRQLYYLPIDLFIKIFNPNTLEPPKGQIYTGGGDFKETGKKFKDFFIEYADLNPESNILDIGSGIGRMAIPLAQYLNHSSKYEGFDVVEKGVKWCERNITTSYPNFTFQYIDLHNDLYKKGGSTAAEFNFPYSANTFDVAISISVFTHMIESEMIHYIKEVYKVLKPGGKCFATFFVYDEQTEPSRNDFQFNYSEGNYALMDKRVKSANVAYELYFLLNSIEKIGFDICFLNRGNWQKYMSEESLDFQDIIVFQKKSK